jgi:hypothetical protein
MNKEEILNQIAELERKIALAREDKSVWTNFWAGSTYNHGPYLRKLFIQRSRAKIKRLRAKL